MFILVGHLNIPLKVENMGESVCVLLKISKGIQSFQNISCQEFMASKKILWLARDFEDRAPRPKGYSPKLLKDLIWKRIFSNVNKPFIYMLLVILDD